METRTIDVGRRKARLVCYIHEDLAALGCDGTYPGRRRAMLVIPGGGYAFVSPREADPVAFRYFAEGYDAFVLYYSVGDDIPLSRPEEEVAEAICEIRRLEGDDAKVAAVGFSAGGHLAASAAAHWATYGKTSRIDALVLAYPVITLDPPYAHKGSADAITEGGKDGLCGYYSIVEQVSSSFPPTFIWSTTTDATVPVENSLMFFDALRHKDVPVELHVYPHGRHGLSLATEETGMVDERAAAWFAESLKFLCEIL